MGEGPGPRSSYCGYCAQQPGEVVEHAGDEHTNIPCIELFVGSTMLHGTFAISHWTMLFNSWHWRKHIAEARHWGFQLVFVLVETCLTLLFPAILQPLLCCVNLAGQVRQFTAFICKNSSSHRVWVTTIQTQSPLMHGWWTDIRVKGS